MKPFRPNRSLILMTTAAALLAGGVAVSQTVPLQPIQWDSRRLEQLDRNVRRLERAIVQRNAQGQPFLVEPDPEVTAVVGRVGTLDRRLADLETTFRRVNGDLERVSLALDDVTRENEALRTRLARTDEQLRTLQEQVRTQAAQAQAAPEPAPQAPASPTGDAAADLAAARALAAGDPARGAAALEAVADNWPDTAQGREAWWRLGDLRRSGRDMAGAVQAYATALAGWPTAAWAGEVTLKLARGLAATDRKPQGCAALGEYDRRYAASASAALAAVAVQVRREAECAA